jgi:SHO1 osmosensor
MCFLGESLFQYGITISIFAALATSYGAQGVHNNIFHNPTAAQKAVAAGWIITCIVNVVWILILSCEPSSYVYRLVANNGRAQSWQPNGGAPPVDAFAHKYAEGVPAALPLQSLGPDGGSGAGAGFRSSGVRGSTGNPESHRRRSAGVWSTPPQTPGGAGSMRDVPPVPEFPVPTHPSDVHEGGPGDRGSGSNVDQTRPPSSLPTTTDATPAPKVIARARALFDCRFSERLLTTSSS